MRFLHTADWHVGKPLRGRSRIAEQLDILAEISDIAARERVDFVLVAGDLFDSPTPRADAEQAVFGFFATLLEKQIPCVVIGGNHDHPKRLEALRQLLDPLRIFIRPAPAAPEDGGILRLPCANGQTAVIAALPWIPDRLLIDTAKLMLPEDQWYAEYATIAGNFCAAFGHFFSRDTVNILSAHLFIEGSTTSASERAIHTSMPFAVSSAWFPTSTHYVALGHLHRPQQVAAPVPSYYSGSTLQLDFGEAGQAKSVNIVEAHPGKPARVEIIPLTKGRKLRDLRGSLDSLRLEAALVGDDFLRVTVESDTAQPGIAAQIREFLPNAVDVRVESSRAGSEQDGNPGNHANFEALAPAELFTEFFRQDQRTDPPEEILQLFRELHQELRANPDDATATA